MNIAVNAGLDFFRNDAFPVIETIDDVMPAVRGNKGIHAYENGPFTVVRYLINSSEVFDSPLACECRGLIFETSSGKLLSRVLHKFFNINERQTASSIDFSQPGTLWEKIDGSMIGTFVHEKQVIFHTRGGLSDAALEARAHASPNVLEAVREGFNKGYTLIFEWVSPNNRVIIDYAEPRLTLLAVRERRTGRYCVESFEQLSVKFGLHTPTIMADKIKSTVSLEVFISRMKDIDGIEGSILSFPDGYRVKIKALPYIRKHKIMGMIHVEKNALRLAVDQLHDDILPSLRRDQATFVENYVNDVYDAIRNAASVVEDALQEVQSLKPDIAYQAIKKKYHPLMGRVILSARKGGDPTELILKLVSQETHTSERATAAIEAFSLPSYEPPAGLFFKG